MKKQRKKSIIRTFLLLVAIPIYIFTNLSWHQIYYYTHSQKSDKKLTPIVVIYNLREIMIKPKRESDGKYEYVSPGNAINYSETKNITFSFDDGDRTQKHTVGFSSYEHKQQILISYSLSQNLEIVSIYKHTPDDITEQKPTPEDQAMVDRYVKQLTDHVLETRVVPPLFNLQWLYDLTFDEKKMLHLGDE